MKRWCSLLVCALVLFVGTGCPIEISYPLGTPGTEKIDKKLVGTWRSTNPEHEVQRMTVTKRDKTSYRVKVLEKGGMFAAEVTDFTAWVTRFEGHTFVYLQADGGKKYSHYAVELKGDELTAWDVSLKVGGIDAVTSTEAFREEVRLSLKTGEGLVSPTVFIRE